MKKKLGLLTIASLLPIGYVISCGTSYQNPAALKYIQDRKDPQYEKNKYNSYFQKTYIDKGYFVADLSESFRYNLNGISESFFNQKASKEHNLESFSSDYNDQLANFKVASPIKIPTLKEVTTSAQPLNLSTEMIQYAKNFLDNYYTLPRSDINGYKLSGYKENPKYIGPNNNKVIIRAMGGPMPYMDYRFGTGISQVYNNNVPVIVLNDSQYSFEPVNANKIVHPKTKAIGPKKAFEELFGINKQIQNYDFLKLVNFALGYIDAQRIENLEDYVIANKQEPYLFGFSQGHTTLQEGMFLNHDVLTKAKKVRTENNSIRSMAGLYRNDDTINYNVRGSGAVLTKETMKDAIAGSKGSITMLFAYVKRAINLGQGIMSIYESIFKTDPQLLKDYQAKVTSTFSPKDWNVGDLTPKEINFYTKNKIDLQITSGETGHSFGFSKSDYFKWLDLNYDDYKNLKETKFIK